MGHELVSGQSWTNKESDPRKIESIVHFDMIALPQRAQFFLRPTATTPDGNVMVNFKVTYSLKE